MASRLRNEEGIGLVELLIAMVVMSIGIFALVAGFSSGVESTRRASKTSTAGTVADARMEAYRRGTYTALGAPADGSTVSTSTTSTGPDGRTYWVGSDIKLTCIFGGLPFMDTSLDPDALRCEAGPGTPPAYPKTRPVTTVSVTVRDGSSSGAVLVKQSSTFEESSGS